MADDKNAPVQNPDGQGTDLNNAETRIPRDSTDVGYDATVANDPVGGFEEVDIDELIDTSEEELEEITGLMTSTPSPTAREDEDPSALPESNIAGEAPTQDM